MKKYILSIATLCIIALASFAQNGITPLSEPFYDGTAMYLYNVHAQKFYTGGNEWGTRASIGDEGLKVYLEKYLVDGVWDGKTVIFRNYVRHGICDVFMGDNELGNVWVDRAGQPNYLWELTQSGSYYRFSMATVCPDYESFYRPGTYLGWDSTLDEGNNSRLWAFMDPAISNHVDWVFMSEASYEAVPKRSVLQATIEQAKSFGIDVSAYELIANNSQATYDELGMAIENLQATINDFMIPQIQGATPSNPKDATFFIKNPQFTEDVTAWRGEPVWGADCAEKWNCNFDVYQDLTGLPNGYYKVSVQGFYRAGSGGSTSMEQHAYFYAGEVSIPLMNINVHAGNAAFEGGLVSDVEGLGIVPNSMATASTAFSAGLYADNTLIVQVTDGTLRIGIKKETLIENDWTIFDNFELYYLGTESENAPLLASGTYYMKNVGADKYLMAANAWGSQASFGEHGLDVQITLANGKYTIDTNVSNGGDNHFLGENGYVDFSVTEWTFIKQSNGTFAITIDGTNFIGYDGESSIMSLSLTDATSPNAQWQFVTKEELVEALSTASSGNPVDATFFIQGPNFGRNDLRNTAWQGSPTYGGEYGNWCAEKFNCNFDVYQNLIGLPNGYYKVSMQGFYRAGDGGSTSMEQHAYFYAGEVSIPLMNINAHAGNAAFEGGNVFDVEGLGFVPNNMAAASTAFSAGLYADNTLTVLVTDGTLRIGIKKETLIENDWTIFDNFELYYLGTECEMGTGPLTADMFKTWDSVGADASSTGAATAELHVGEELGGGATVYGDPSVYFLTFADLTGYDKIVFEGTPGVQLRVLMNRVEHEGALIEVNPTIGEDGKTEVDLTDYEFVHLNAIKIGWGSPVGTITAINLVKAVESEGEVERVSLEEVEFNTYDGWGPDAKKTGTATPEWIMNAPSSCPYGDPSVNNGADLSAFSKMFITVSPESEGMRILMNRKIVEGQCADTEEASNLISIPSHAWCTQKYCKQEGLTYIIDLAQILKDQGFVRLHAIKGASWSTTATIESIELERATSGDITLDEKNELLSINFDDGTNLMMGWGNNSTNEVVDGVLKITNPSAVNSWEAQIAYDFEKPFIPDCEYTLTMKVRGSAPGQISIDIQNADDNYASVGEFGTVNFDTDWKDVEMACLCNGEGGKRLVFSFGQFVGDIYIDDLKLLVAAENSTQNSEYNDAQGILYQLNSQNTFTVTGYDETLNSDIVILENIGDKPVTHIKAGAFKNAYALNSVTIPSSITTVEASAFSGCHNLLVVKWNADAPLNADCFDNPEEYGNMLVFVTNANLTRNYKGNVVVNGVAENIQLIDGRPFRNPQEFTAKKISYTRHFTKKSKVGAPAGWEGMVLPFDVQTITSETKGLLAPFGKSNLTSTRPFWMARWQTSSEWFTRSTVFAANEPFIIAMPNSDEYDESFNIEGDVIFYSLNTKVHTTELQSEDGNFSLNGCYESVPSSSQIYALNDEEYTAPRGGGVFMPGGAFVANSRDIRPFEAYIYNAQLATTRRYIPVQGGGIATGIDRIMLKEGKQCVDVYTLQGIMVKHQIPVEDLEKDLPKGIYVVDGKKFVVK